MRFHNIRAGTICLLVLACTSCAGEAQADDFTVAVESIDYPPLYDGTNPDNYRGFARELLDMFGARYQHRLHYVPLPLNRLYAEFFSAGEFDFKFPDNPKWQMEIRKSLAVSYSEPVVNVSEGVFVPANMAGRGLGALKTVATLTGFTPLPYSKLIQDGSLRMYYADSLDSLAKMLSIGRVDGIYLSDLAMRSYETGHDGKDRFVLDRTLPGMSAAYSLSTIKHPGIIRQFNQFLRTEHERIAALKKKYGVAESDAN